jgi:putative phosphoribosyl transferase
MLFENRKEAGRALARLLSAYADRDDVIVLALPRGGVPVAFEVARALGAPMDVFVVRKLGVPGYEELATGAIASGGVRFLNEEMIAVLGLPGTVIEATTARERTELERREQRYRGDRPPPDVRDRTVLLVDDGLATGSTMRAAVETLRRLSPSRIVVAVPVADPTTCAEMAAEADDVVCARTPRQFRAVGLWYADFSQTTDDEVRDLLGRATERHHARAGRTPSSQEPRECPRERENGAGG